MKAERPSHHKSVIKEEVSVTNGDDISECLKKLSLESAPEKSKNVYNILVERPKDGNITVKDVKKEKTKDVGSEEVKNEADDNKSDQLCSKKDDLTKEDEKSKIEEKPVGELCARGPEPKSKWKTQSRASVLPYSTLPQSNTALTNGGSLYLNHTPIQLTSDALYSEISPSDQISALKHDFNFVQEAPVAINDGNQFTQNIYEASNLTDILGTEEFQPQDTYDASKPDLQNDQDYLELINEVVNDPVKIQNVLQDYQSQALNIVPTGVNSYGIISPHNAQDQTSPYSPPQVVPNRRPSSYSTGSGSSSGPSSPNLYANTPTFSPNIPSPRGILVDDSSNHLYATPPYCTTMLQSPLQRPLSSCSSTSSTNLSHPEPDPIDLNVIYQEPYEEGKRKELQELTKELQTTCSEVYSKSQYQLGMPQNPPISSVPLPSSSVVITACQVLQITGPAAQSPTLIRSSSNSSIQSSATRLRKILPKPIEKSVSSPPCEPLQTYDASPGQYTNQNKLAQDQRKAHMTAKEQLILRLRQDVKEKFWARVQSLSDEEIAQVDPDGDTPLMILACDTRLSSKPEQLYALVERCKTLPGVLCARNKGEHSALYIACMSASHDPLLVKYIAEAIMEVNIDLNEVDSGGHTLIHLLCKEGNKYAEVLDHLLSLRDLQGKQCFDINKSDYDGRSPLHQAVETHYMDKPSLEIIQVLLRNGADILKKDRKQGSTALHFAVATTKMDKYLIHTLCNSTKLKCELVNATNYTGETPLHVAMAHGGNVDAHTHNYILEILMGAGASRAVRNHSGKAPLELAPEIRKGEVKRLLDKYNSK